MELQVQQPGQVLAYGGHAGMVGQPVMWPPQVGLLPGVLPGVHQGSIAVNHMTGGCVLRGPAPRTGIEEAGAGSRDERS